MWSGEYPTRRVICKLPLHFTMASGAVSLKDTGYSGASSNGAPVIKLKENGEHRRDAGDVDNEKKGLLHPGALTVVVSWYVVSFVVLIINKHVLSTLGGDAVILSEYTHPYHLYCK